MRDACCMLHLRLAGGDVSHLLLQFLAGRRIRLDGHAFHQLRHRHMLRVVVVLPDRVPELGHEIAQFRVIHQLREMEKEEEANVPCECVKVSGLGVKNMITYYICLCVLEYRGTPQQMFC